MKPVLGPDGKPLYARARNLIGTGYPNAIARWSREHHPEATAEHDEDGYHRAGFHCKGVFRVRLDPNRVGETRRPAIEKWSKYVGGGIVTIDVWSDGEGEIELPNDLPSEPLIVATPTLREDVVGMQAEVVATPTGNTTIHLLATWFGGSYVHAIDVLIFG